MSGSARTTGLLAVAVGLVALAVRVALVARSVGLGGIDGYDGGVYYAAATSLLWGRLPYQDFVLLHPPGIMLLLTPFALLGRLSSDTIGFEAARGVSLLVGAVNAALLVTVVRRAGAGAVAAVVAGLLYAVWTPAAKAETTIRLEPWVTLGLVLALLLLTGTRRPTRAQLVLAGGCLALAFSVKIWAVAPALFVLLWCWRRWGRGAAARLLLGIGLGAAVVDLPFFLASPAVMWRMVVLDQLGRPRIMVPMPLRVVETLLDGRNVDPSTPAGHLAVAALAVVGCLLVVGGVRTALGRLALGLLVVQLVVLALSPSFASYYPAFAAPAVVLLVAATVGVVVARGRRGRSGAPLRRLAGAGAAALTLAAVVAALGVVARVDSHVTVRLPFPAATLAADAAGARCVTSDSPDALMLTNLYTRDLAHGCPAPVDLSGLRYDVDALPPPLPGHPAPPLLHSRAHNRKWQHSLVTYLLHGRMIFIMRPADDGVSALLRHRVLQLPRIAAGPGYQMFAHARGASGSRPA